MDPKVGQGCVVMIRPRVFKLAKAINDLECVISHPGYRQSIFDGPLKEVSSILRQTPSPELVSVICIQLGMIKAWVLANEGLNILRGGDNWRTLHLAMWFECVRLQLEFLRQLSKPASERGVRLQVDGALVLAHALAVNDRVMADAAAAAIVNGVDLGCFSAFTQFGFEAFVINLYFKFVGSGETRVQQPLYTDYYGEVLEAWNQPERLAVILHSLCDLHLEYAQKTSSKFYAQFAPRPFDSYPVEIMAINCVRRRLGDRSVACDHSLMSSPLSAFPNQVATTRDDLLESVIRFAKKAFGLAELLHPLVLLPAKS